MARILDDLWHVLHSCIVLCGTTFTLLPSLYRSGVRLGKVFFILISPKSRNLLL